MNLYKVIHIRPSNKRLNMVLRTPGDYEELAIEWQYQMILILKEKLSIFSVDEDRAKEIVGEFAFDLTMLHDQEEIKVNEKTYNPSISFDDFNRNLISSDHDSELHEYAFGSTSEAYDE